LSCKKLTKLIQIWPQPKGQEGGDEQATLIWQKIGLKASSGI